MENLSAFKQLMDQFLIGKMSREENRQLQELLRDEALEPQLENYLKESFSYADDAGATEWVEEFEKKLLTKMEQEKNAVISTPIHRVHFLKTVWFRYAAAVILVVGITAYLWIVSKETNRALVSHNKPASSTLTSDIAPGRDRAILTLANGKQILLDSTQGNIVQQGSLTVVNLAGKLKYQGEGSGTEYNTISTPKGGQYQILLPDGSKVWLNAASSIKFPTAFIGNVRQVEMTGEAYMEVEKNPSQSFIVKANGTEIQVLGTSFNVNAYTDEATIKTTLITGSVKVLKGKDQVILQPGQQAAVNRTNQNPVNLKIPEIMIQTADIEQTLAWKNGAFQFNWTKLADAMRQIARWYDIEVIYEQGVPDIKLEGDIKRNLTLSQVLDILGELGVKYRIEGKQLIIREK